MKKYNLIVQHYPTRIFQSDDGVILKCISQKEKIFCEHLKNEFELIKKLSHPNIIEFQEFQEGFFIQGEFNCLITMKKYEQDFFKYILLQQQKLIQIQTGHTNFKEIKQKVLLLVQAVQYLHNNNISHNDIKPENVFLGLKDSDLVLADFGLARQHSDIITNPSCADDQMNWQLRYNSPQLYELTVLNQKIVINEFKNDIFSLGILIYLAIFFRFPKLEMVNPKEDKFYKHIIEKNLKNFVEFSKQTINYLDENEIQESCDLLIQMLAYEENDRLNIEQVLQHKFFKI